MRRAAPWAAGLLGVALCAGVEAAGLPPQVVDLPTRPGVTLRFLYAAPAKTRSTVVLFTGGSGEVGIRDDGSLRRGGNFLARSRDLFVERGLAVALLDPPSDRPAPAFLSHFRQTREHAADVRAVIAWLRRKAQRPVWLVGTSRGTQSVAWIATQLPRSDGGPDGIVLSSTILKGAGARDRAVPEMALDRITVPVLVVHHEDDACALCRFSDMPLLMRRLAHAPRGELIAVRGGASRGDACGPFSHHGYNGIERYVVGRIAGWILAP